METWVTTQGPDILHGRAAGVAGRIRQLAQDHPPAGPEHAKIIRATLSYLAAREPYLDYPRALAAGWPIATGVIKGACRHLVNDRMVSASPAPAGAWKEPRPSCGYAPSAPAATRTPTGTTTSPGNTTATTSAATSTPFHSPHDPYSKQAAPGSGRTPVPAWRAPRTGRAGTGRAGSPPASHRTGRR
jgi:hypothetical protein